MNLIEKKKKLILLSLGVLFIANILVWSIVLELNKSKFLEVNFFNVGQGDSIFIQTPKRTQILIDGGPSSKVLEKLGKEMPFYDRSINFVISSHPDPDHLLGLIDVLKRYKVDLFGFNGTKSSKPEFQVWEEQISKNKIPLIILKKGQRVSVGDNLYFEILAPLENFEGREVSDFNTSSIVARMVYGNTSFLFTGDATKSIEKELINEGISLDSDVLKVGHHGSRTSTIENFLEAVKPGIAIIQVGKDNQYSHPHPEVLANLEKFGIKIFRTDKNGDIKIISNGKIYGISTF